MKKYDKNLIAFKVIFTVFSLITLVLFVSSFYFCFADDRDFGDYNAKSRFTMYTSYIVSILILMFGQILFSKKLAFQKILTAIGLGVAFIASDNTHYELHDFYHVFVLKGNLSISSCSDCSVGYYVRILPYTFAVLLALLIIYIIFGNMLPKAANNATPVVLTVFFSVFILYFLSSIPLSYAVWESAGKYIYDDLESCAKAIFAGELICLAFENRYISAQRIRRQQNKA